jgi:hypothetical protein
MPLMIKHGLSQLRQRLQAIHAELGALVPVLVGRQALLKAYLRYQPRTCGNPGCRCARGERHPAWIMQVREGGRVRCRSIPKETFEALREPAEEYRRFRQARARWNRLVREANEAIEAIERGRTLKSREALEEP